MSVNIKQTYRARPTNPIRHPPIALTNFDILIPKIYILSHYFFKNVNNEIGFMDSRKIFSSFEDILTDYYPLAGRLKFESNGRMSILSSDQGVPFIIAESPDITIKQLEERNWENSSIPDGLMPTGPKAEPDGPLIAIQHTKLADGSVVLGVSVHHSIADGHGIFTFLENWGRKARREPFPLPVHNRTLLKPNGDSQSMDHPEYLSLNFSPYTVKSNANPTDKLPTISRKIFYFSKDNLKKLQKAYSSNNPDDTWISTNDALVAHINRTTARARGLPLNELTVSLFACDGRNKFNPPLPQNYFGNVALTAYPKTLVSDLINGPRSKIALNMRKGHTEINDEKARSVLDWLEQQQQNKLYVVPNLNLNKDFFITNWSKFPIYTVDFGYGTPAKYRSVRNASQYSGVAVLIGTPEGDGGVEMYINLSPEHMENLEQDPEFKMFQ